MISGLPQTIKAHAVLSKLLMWRESTEFQLEESIAAYVRMTDFPRKIFKASG